MAEDFIKLVGNTPLIRLNGPLEETGCEILGKAEILNPVVLSFIFFIIISPVALIGKIFGRDELNLKLVDKETFWKKKDLENTKPSSFNNHF